jgi:hypothetical protein
MSAGSFIPKGKPENANPLEQRFYRPFATEDEQ